MISGQATIAALETRNPSDARKCGTDSTQKNMQRTLSRKRPLRILRIRCADTLDSQKPTTQLFRLSAKTGRLVQNFQELNRKLSGLA